MQAHDRALVLRSFELACELQNARSCGYETFAQDSILQDFVWRLTMEFAATLPDLESDFLSRLPRWNLEALHRFANDELQEAHGSVGQVWIILSNDLSAIKLSMEAELVRLHLI